jgi:hypothetical protein
MIRHHKDSRPLPWISSRKRHVSPYMYVLLIPSPKALRRHRHIA